MTNPLIQRLDIESYGCVVKASFKLTSLHAPIGPNVLTRHPTNGTRAVLLCETPNHEERSKIYLNGRRWVAYGDGTAEQALVEGGPRP